MTLSTRGPEPLSILAPGAVMPDLTACELALCVWARVCNVCECVYTSVCARGQEQQFSLAAHCLISFLPSHRVLLAHLAPRGARERREPR